MFVSRAHTQVSCCFMVTPPPIQLASLGMADTLILMVLALVVFGPRRLPQIGRQIGKIMYEFRKASNDFKFQMEEELRASEEADRRKKEEAERERNLALTAPVQAAENIEAEAGIGAAAETPATGDAMAESLSAVSVPRIQPPQSGEQVSAASPTANVSHLAESSTEAETIYPETVPESTKPETPTEPVSQHG